MYEKVSTDLNFVDREKQVEKFWKDEKIFEKSLNTLSAVENGQVEVFENLQAIEKNEAKAREELDIYVINCMLSSVTWKNVTCQVFLNPS